MPSLIVDASNAWANAGRDRDLQSSRSDTMFRHTICAVAYRPKFLLQMTDRVFCIGSCFARNIEDQLLYRGIDVLSKSFHSPFTEWPWRPNAIVNKFTVHSMLNELSWAITPTTTSNEIFALFGNEWLDLQLAPGQKGVTRARCEERRAYLTGQYFARLRRADVAVVTLGLNEVWKDEASRLFLNCTPPWAATRSEPRRYAMHVTTVEENVLALESLRLALKTLSPNIRVVLSVSPVPLGISFSGADAIVANSRSKSVLRAAAEEFVHAHDDVDYFPSYEMVMLAPRAQAFAPDCHHVSDSAVSAIVETFLLANGLPPERPHPEFNELAYLAANPDVDTAVRCESIASGYHHWLNSGREDNRPLWPDAERATMMRHAGIGSASGSEQ